MKYKLYNLCIMLHKYKKFCEWFELYQDYILPLTFKCYLPLSPIYY